MAFSPIEPKDIDTALADPTRSVGFPLHTFGVQFGLTWAEVQSELIAGALIAHGAPVENGYKQVMIKFENAAKWFASGRPLAIKARAFIDSGVKQ